MLSPRGVPGSLPGTRALCFYARLVEAPLEAVANQPTFRLAGAVAPRRGLVRASALAQSGIVQKVGLASGPPPVPGTYGCVAVCPWLRVIPVLTIRCRQTAFLVPQPGAASQHVQEK